MQNSPTVTAKVDTRKQEDLLNALQLAEKTVYKTYLENLNDLEILPCPQELQEESLQNIAQFFKLERFVREKKENIRDKLISVFHAVASAQGSILVLLVSNGGGIDFYIGTKIMHSIDSTDILEKSLKGNFPGTILKPVYEGDELDALVKQVFEITDAKRNKQQKQVCTVTGVAGLRSKEESSEKHFIQGVEKLIDSLKGASYSLLLIADPLSSAHINAIRHGYEKLYSQLVTFAGSDLSFGENESESISNSISEGLSKSISDSVSDTVSRTEGNAHTLSGGFGVGAGMPMGASMPASTGITPTAKIPANRFPWACRKASRRLRQPKRPWVTAPAKGRAGVCKSSLKTRPSKTCWNESTCN